MDDLLPEFLTETNEALADLDLALVKLERDPGDRETLALIFRLVHTIKGTCGFLGLPRLERVAHAGENVLGRMRDGELAASQAVISLVLMALDRIKLIVAGLGATGAEPEGDDQAVIDQLNQAASGAPLAAPAAESPAPPAAEAVPGAVAAVAAVAAPAEAAAQTIRVPVEVLEELMTLVGELVLTRNQLMQLARAEAAAGAAASAFTPPLQRLSQITADLQEKVMKTRMQPIGSAWNKLPRLVRDLALETGKQITLEMHGQETELDRQVLELMRDPLTHMVRNSADHGLESPAARRAAGKPETGRITLRAYHEGGHIIIEVGDDGGGIPVARVGAKAVAKGLVSEAELAAMTDQQIRAFIFRAGFSTAENVTAISGRGVGMDVVRANIERIGGTIELASTQGAGTNFTVKIPLTLAIVSAVIVQAGGERFAIPQIAVRELVRVEAAGTDAALRIEALGGAPMLRLRDELLPLVQLSELLRLPEAPCDPEEGTTVVVVSVGSLRMGIVVAEVFDTEEIVVKPVAPVLRHVTMFSGNTILGDGAVIMILDPNGVARSAGVAARSNRADGPAALRHGGSEEAAALLLFRAPAGPCLFAVPLSLVARLETIEAAKIETAGGGYVTQYRGRLMKLIALQEEAGPPAAEQPVLVFVDGVHSMGLMVGAIVDVVHARLDIELSSARAGVLGTALIAGQAADVLDTGHYLRQAWQDWLVARPAGVATKPRVLVVDDSDFFRHLVLPSLSAAGFDVTAAPDAAAALALRDGGLAIDAIVSDIEMPGMDGLAFVRAARAAGAWRALPMIALSAHDSDEHKARALEAGFSFFVRKSERAALLAQLHACVAAPETVAA